jgi:hypothetical protein
MHVSTTGFELADALGAYTNWFGVDSSLSVPSAPGSVSAAPSDAGVRVSWTAPSDPGDSAITGYQISFGTHTIETGAAVRSAFAGPRINGAPATIAVRARNAQGLGPPRSATATPVAAPQAVHPVPAVRLFDTRNPAVVVDSTQLFKIAVAGKAGVPASGAKAVQIAVTIVHPSATGVLRVRTWGESSTDVAAIAYRYGEMTTATITVPLFASSTIAFVPSAGSIELMADVMSWSGTSGSEVTAVAPVALDLRSSVPTDAGVVVPVRKFAVVGTSSVGVVVAVNATTTSTSGWLRLWSSGAAPTVNQVSVAPGGPNSNIVVLPIGSDGAIRIASSSASIGAKITLLGVVKRSAGSAALLESFPMVGTADDVTHTGSLIVADAPATLAVLGTAQVPATGVQAVLVHVTVLAGDSSGSIWLYPAGGTHTTTPTLTFSGATAITTTVLVRPGAGGAISLVTSGPSVTVAIDTGGYVTS